jgi:hypothetical protein
MKKWIKFAVLFWHFVKQHPIKKAASYARTAAIRK